MKIRSRSTAVISQNISKVHLANWLVRLCKGRRHRVERSFSQNFSEIIIVVCTTEGIWTRNTGMHSLGWNPLHLAILVEMRTRIFCYVSYANLQRFHFRFRSHLSMERRSTLDQVLVCDIAKNPSRRLLGHTLHAVSCAVLFLPAGRSRTDRGRVGSAAFLKGCYERFHSRTSCTLLVATFSRFHNVTYVRAPLSGYLLLGGRW